MRRFVRVHRILGESFPIPCRVNLEFERMTMV